MAARELYSIEEARALLGGIARNVLVVIDLLRAMHLVCGLLYHTIGDRLQSLGIDEELQQGAHATLRALKHLEKQLQARTQAT